MTVVNPKSISGINSITTGSGSDDILTIHTNNGTERLRVDSTGTTKIVTGIVTTLTATTGIVTTLTANTVTSLGAVSGTTGTFTGDVDIADKIVHTGDTNTAIRFPSADTVTAETGGSERARIDSSGRLMLGTTTEGFAGADELTIATSGSTGITIRSGTSNDGNIYFSDGDDGSSAEYQGYVQYEHAHGRINFGTGGSTRVKIDGANLNISNGNLKFETSGKGIDFSATGDASGKTSEVLDDYEEGTWSPLWSDATSGGTTSSGQMHGRYTKIGRMVTAHFYTWGLPTGPSGAIILQGLPYTAGEIGEVFGSVQAGYYNDGNTSTYNLGIYIVSGNTYGRLAWNSAGNNDVVAASFSGFINGYTNFTGTLVYLTA